MDAVQEGIIQEWHYYSVDRADGTRHWWIPDGQHEWHRCSREEAIATLAEVIERTTGCPCRVEPEDGPYGTSGPRLVHDAAIDVPAGRSEYRDCSVRAVAALADVTYDQAYVALALSGREPNRGAITPVILDALGRLGYSTTKIPTRPFAAYRAPSELPKARRYLLLMVDHCAAYVGGQVLDWTASRHNRVRTLYLVEREDSNN